MSLPKFPELPENYNFDNAICQILTSIAMEEIGLSHIINAEGEKLQYILGTIPGAKAPEPTIGQVLEINESVKDMLQQVAFNQMFLNAKMSGVLKAYLQNKKDGGEPVEPPEPPDPNIRVEILGDEITVLVGFGVLPTYIIEPAEYENRAVWSSSDPSIATVSNNGGIVLITGHKEGTAVITLTVDGICDTLIVHVTERETNEKLPLNGDGPFQPRVDLSDLENNYSLIVKINKLDNTVKYFQKGSIKLKDILLIDNFDGISVKTKNPDLTTHFWIAKDKNNEDAIIYDYYPPDKAFTDIYPEMPEVHETLILSKESYEDTEIKVILRYDGSHYQFEP